MEHREELKSELPGTGARLEVQETAPHPRFSEEVEQLMATLAEGEVRLGDVLEVMHNRGYTFLLMLLSFPFCTPIPLPGVSMPFGLVIAVIGLRLGLGRRPWLPAALLRVRLPEKFFPSVLAATRRLAGLLEHLLKPRLGELVRSRAAGNGMGVMIFICGLLLMLPFPLPLTNGLPALTVLLLASARMERDGYFAIAGAVAFVLTLLFFAGLFWGGAEMASWLQEKAGILFHRPGGGDM